MFSPDDHLKKPPEGSPLHDLVGAIAEERTAAGDPALFTRLLNLAAAAQLEADQVRQALDIERAHFHATFEQAPVGIAHVAPDGRFLRVNGQFARITGYSVAALVQHGFQQITHPDDLVSDLAHVQRLLSGADDRYTMEKRYIRPGGSTVWVKLTVALIRDAKGTPDFFISVMEDLSEIKRAHAEAVRDPLTGLLNRRGFLDRATREIKRAARTPHMLMLVYLDLDGFKAINDRRGHAAGDACLCAVARLLEAMTRPGDALARFGGDEFTLLLPHLSARDAAQRLEQLRTAIKDYGTEAGHAVTASFGAAFIQPDRDTCAEQLIQRADEAMLLAKRSDKNCVRFANLDSW
ncbi:sensor domain-containing diguanylate cyclase [Rhizorhabdus argentea]|uniref:sensor domain-containing diguanylate cyclase n=1 Tax=Rhizorhabdus argentea TaxID=1387174 RepID=UPI0030ED122A